MCECVRFAIQCAKVSQRPHVKDFFLSMLLADHRAQAGQSVLINCPNHFQKRPRHWEHGAALGTVDTRTKDTRDLAFHRPQIVPPEWIIYEDDSVCAAEPCLDQLEIAPAIDDPARLIDELCMRMG